MNLPDEPKARLAIALQEKAKRLRENRLSSYKPYEKQKEFHNAGRTHRERLFMAGNQCLSPWTLIETADSTVPAAEVPFLKDGRAVSWDGESERVGRISSSFLMGIEPAFRLVTATGRWFDCSANHQILTEHGYCRIDQLVSRSGGLRLSHRLEDYQASCVEHGYLYDPQLHLEADSALDELPSLGDVRKHSLIFSHKDAAELERQYTNAFQASFPLPISAYDRGKLLALFEPFLCPCVPQAFLHLRGLHRNVLQFLGGLWRGPQSSRGFVAQIEAHTFRDRNWALSPVDSGTPEQPPLSPQSCQQFLGDHTLESLTERSGDDVVRIQIFYPFDFPSLVGGESIVAVVPIGYQPIIDFQVPDTNNYKAGGVYHHNCGKTISGGFEMAMHLTGKYPDDWAGFRFDRPTRWWAAGQTGETTRDNPQKVLMGPPEDEAQFGTGAIPKADILDWTKKMGTPNALDSVVVQHVSGGKSYVGFKTYDQGRLKWQGPTLDGVWFDEQAPEDVYSEGLTRTNATGGIVYTTFTPLLGVSGVVMKFLSDEKTEDRHVTTMTIEDAEHYTPDERAKIIASYPEHERDARAKGIPMLGEGRVFPLSEDVIKIAPFPIPAHWPRIGALDFGWDHPTAASEIAWDRDTDIVYVTKCYRKSKEIPAVHAAALKPWGANMPWAWPNDGRQTGKGDGMPLQTLYRQAGMKLLPEHAQYPDGSVSVEAGVMEMLERMRTGRWKVFSTCLEWFDEFNLYHRKDGRIVKERDDVLSSSRYAMVSRRFARVDEARKELDLSPKRRIIIPNGNSAGWMGS